MTDTPTAQSDVDIALARANAAASGEQPAAGTDAKGEESLEVKNRRLEAQVQALQQRTSSAPEPAQPTQAGKRCRR